MYPESVPRKVELVSAVLGGHNSRQNFPVAPTPERVCTTVPPY